MSVRATKASSENLEELANLQRDYMDYHKEVDQYFACKPEATSLWIDYMKEILGDDNHIVYCAFKDDRIVGYMTAQVAKRTPLYQMEEVGMIGDAFVLPEFRGQGVFTLLFEKTIEWLRGRGMTFVEHPVASQNALGLKAWKSKDFEDFMIFMRKKLE